MERILYCIRWRQIKLAPGPQIFTEEMDGIIHHNSQTHGSNIGNSHIDIAGKQAPESKGHYRRHNIGNNAEQTNLQTAEGKNQHKGDNKNSQRGRTDHTLDITLGDMGKHNPHAGPPGRLGNRPVLRKPLVGPFLKILQLAGRQAFLDNGETHGRTIRGNKSVHILAKG